MSKSRFVLLDRDGVLNENREHYVRCQEELVVFSWAPRAISLLRSAGARILVVTNQAGVGKGLIPVEMLHLIHKTLQNKLQCAHGGIDQFYYCPHRPNDGCKCRKPRPGMIERAAKEWGFDKRETWFVGDSLRDVEAAHAAGCLPALVRSGVGDYPTAIHEGTPVHENVLEFAQTWVKTHGPLTGLI